MSAARDGNGALRRTLEFRPTADERRAYLAAVVSVLERRGFVARVETLRGVRAHVFARHPYGLEHSCTIDVASRVWAYSLSSAPMNADDVAQALIRLCRGRGGERA
jgi:hypothetical protein